MSRLICQVCSDRASGFHFGAYTCEGCKSFFVRSCKPVEWNVEIDPNQYIPPEPKVPFAACKLGGHCDLLKVKRKACRWCRWQRCIKARMSRTQSRYGRPVTQHAKKTQNDKRRTMMIRSDNRTQYHEIADHRAVENEQLNQKPLDPMFVDFMNQLLEEADKQAAFVRSNSWPSSAQNYVNML